MSQIKMCDHKTDVVLKIISYYFRAEKKRRRQESRLNRKSTDDKCRNKSPKMSSSLSSPVDSNHQRMSPNVPAALERKSSHSSFSIDNLLQNTQSSRSTSADTSMADNIHKANLIWPQHLAAFARNITQPMGFILPQQNNNGPAFLDMKRVEERIKYDRDSKLAGELKVEPTDFEDDKIISENKDNIIDVV